MDHNLEDSLNLDTAMGVDFETAGDQVVSQADISLDAESHETTIPMEFESIEEHPMLMDAENEQIIGYSDDHFNLQEYDIQQEDNAGANTTVVTSEPSISQAQEQTILDIQFDPQSFVSSAPKIDPPPPKLIAVKAGVPPRFTALKKESLVVMPRQVAIAPKPPPPRAAPPAPRALLKRVSLAPAGQAAPPNTVLGECAAIIANIKPPPPRAAPPAPRALLKRVSLAPAGQAAPPNTVLGECAAIIANIKPPPPRAAPPAPRALLKRVSLAPAGQAAPPNTVLGECAAIIANIKPPPPRAAPPAPRALLKRVSLAPAGQAAPPNTVLGECAAIIANIKPPPPRAAPPAPRALLKRVSLAPAGQAAPPNTVLGECAAIIANIKPPPPRAAPPAPRALLKRVSLAPAGQAAPPNTVLAQIGKQLVMVPAGSGQKIKLVTTSGGVPNIQYIRAGQGEQAQLITRIAGSTKPMLTKFIVQAQPTGDAANQPAVLTKLLGAAPAARLVTVAQAAAPGALSNKVLLTSPTKQTVRITKKPQFIEIKSPTQKIINTSQAGTGGTKKVVITATPAPNVIYKAAPVKTVGQVNKDGAVQGQKTQLHQINVPGKGIQYFRLVSNPAAPRLKPAAAARPGPTIMLTDNKGNVLQVGGEKAPRAPSAGAQPPPLVISGAALNKLTSKPQQKLVRIAPVGSKPAMAATQAAARSEQSLLAPLSPAPPDHDADSKAALRALIVDAGAPTSPEEAEKSADGSEDAESSGRDKVEPLIVVPTYLKPHDAHADDSHAQDDEKRFNSFEAQSFNSFQEPATPQALSENEMVPNELGMRPRKACNCTKSQCLKLYCDCFANGEFCNRCNCNNCHNNLENEELRQKAIRGCLDRNPNAFRPKIGKAKSGGPEIVRRHNKGCNCKRSGCLKNYCECYEAKIACTAMCKCVGCRNVEESLERRRRLDERHVFRPPALPHINFMTTEVIEAVCQCLLAAAGEADGAGGGCGGGEGCAPPDRVRDVLDEFSRCLQDIVAAAHHAPATESRA